MKLFPSDYREILREELAKRRARNPRYSLRAFAKSLGLRHSRLSEVLNGLAGFSRERALQIAAKLELPPADQERFADLVEREHARSREKRKLAEERLRASLGGEDRDGP